MASTVPPTPAQPSDDRRRVRLFGSRAEPSEHRRAKSLGGAIGVTALGAILPGTGFLYSGRRLLGWSVLALSLMGLGFAWWYAPRDRDRTFELVFDPTQLKVAAALLAGAVLVWMVVVVTTYVVVRPKGAPQWQSWLGAAFVTILCLAVAAPVAVTAKYATVQADLVSTLFENNESATTPRNVTKEDPWGGRERVTLLLLGGDGGVHRDGVRTDSMILVSMDTQTGRTVMFSLPRNLMYAQFPPGPLRKLYPDGFDGEGDPGNWMLNAVYRQVPALHPHVLGKSDNEGADALKLAIQGSIGVPVDYYMLVNLEGFQQVVDAMGGVTVNINQSVPIGGNTTQGVEPDDWLQPGPNQHLDGFEALWFARGRYGSDDYERMERQRCMIDAIIDEADPVTLIRRYQSLASVGKEIVRTDIPKDLLPAFVDLALEVKDAKVKSVVFRSSDEFYPGDPDFDWLREVADQALAPADKSNKPRRKDPGTAVDPNDACAYDPEP